MTVLAKRHEHHWTVFQHGFLKSYGTREWNTNHSAWLLEVARRSRSLKVRGWCVNHSSEKLYWGMPLQILWLKSFPFSSFFAIRYSPVGIMFLIMGKMASVGDFSELISSLGFYFLTVLLGLAIHALIVLPSIFYFFCRRNPFAYASGVAQALATAFGTSSRWAWLICRAEWSHVA